MTTQQRLFNMFMEEYYPELEERFEKDFLHQAYVNVFERFINDMHRGTFGHLVSNSYHRARRKEFSRAMHFIVPDPIFWILQAEQLEEPQPEDEGFDAEAIEREKKNVHSFLKSLFSPKEVYIYDLVMHHKYDVKALSELTGWSKSRISELIDKMEDAIRNDYCQPKGKGKA